MPPPSPADNPTMDDLRRALSLAMHQADHDDLTGLLNRRGLHRRLLAWDPQTPAAVVFADVNHLKQTNEQAGHAQGDATLVQTARILTHCLGPDALLARWGGDEFVAVTPCASRLDLPASANLSWGEAQGMVANFTDLLAKADAQLREKRRQKRSA